MEARYVHTNLIAQDWRALARFYESVFGMERVVRGDTPFGNALMLSDGVINLALLNFPEGTKGMLNGPDWAGLHHMGFIVDDVDTTAAVLRETFDLEQYRGGSQAFRAIGDEHGLLLAMQRGRMLGFGEARPADVFPTAASIRGVASASYREEGFPYEILAG